jgi:hypothetical protein
MLAHAETAVDRFNAQAARWKWPTHCDARLAFDSSRLSALLGIWKSVKGERALPKRSDFSARILAKHLRDITFVDRIEEPGHGRRYRFRLFGSALSRFTGDWTGKFLDEAVSEPFLPSWLATYDTVVEMAQPLRFTTRFRAAHLEHVLAENLVAPLAGEGGASAGLLVSVTYSPVVS